MGKGGRGKGAKKSPAAELMAEEPAAVDAKQPTGGGNVADMESKFMQALQREMGDVEITEASVREYIAKMTPEQRERLMSEGKDLKHELLTNSDHEEELNVFRKELNAKAEAAGLPVEKDGEHLGKKLLAHMRTSTEQPSHLLVLDAIASSSYLVKLAVAEVREGAPKADAADLAAIEAALRALKVNGWQSESEEAGRAPFVRRNLLLLHYVLYHTKIEHKLQPATIHALNELQAKVSCITDMLFQYCLQNRWVKAALTVTELQALLLNGLWDHKEDECREAMAAKMQKQGLKLPKLLLNVSAADVAPGESATIKCEITRLHAYEEAELGAARAAIVAREAGAAQQLATPKADEAAAEAAPGGDELPKEGWWVIAEGLRSKKGKEQAGEVELSHNSLVGRQVLASALDAPVMWCEVLFQAPTEPGEYKVMVHVRSTGCVGVDVRRKVTFNVKQPKRAPLSKASTEATAAAAEDDVPPLTADDVPPLQE